VTKDGQWNRRSLLRGAAVLAGVAATVPLLEGVATALAASDDADALFKAGKFEQAGRAYERILKADPTNLHAARQRGYVGLLANRFPDAEKYLTMALNLAPDDTDTNLFLGDCYIRQNKFALSAPRWQAGGDENYAKWFAAVPSDAYQTYGDIGQLPFLRMDPSPLVEVSVNGGPAKRFMFYTGSPWTHVSPKVAHEAGLTPIVSYESDFEGTKILQCYGLLDSLQLGGIELRKVPVAWSVPESDEAAPSDDDGMIGCWLFYHLLTTFDYAGRSLILQPRTPETAAKARADATKAGVKPLPLWMAHENMLHSTGSIENSGPRPLGVNFGGIGEVTGIVNGDTAERLHVRTDTDRPIETFAHSHPAVAYPCYPKEIRLGSAIAKDAYCYTNPRAQVAPFGFDVLGSVSHCFHKPYTATLDFTDMNLYITRGKPT
jgi:tetratricopeptide (TPR) repeat protein